jgi:hypothetical protein
MMRGSNLALLASLSFFIQNSSAFTPNVLSRKVVSPPGVPRPLLSTLDSNNNDGSIDPKTNDQSIRSAYEQWRFQYAKGAADPQRFENFKTNYLTLAGANAVAIQKARENGRTAPSLLSLNEYGDCTTEEYKTIRSGAIPPPEPEVKPAALATGSQPDGFQMLETMEDFEHDFQDTEPVDRMKGAYMDWCEKHGKDMDDLRYRTFSGHYLALEEHWGETGNEMKLNEYADCTVEEYAQLMELESINVSTAKSMLTDPESLRLETSGTGASKSTVASLLDTLGSSWGDAQAHQSSSPPSSNGAGFGSFLGPIVKPAVSPKSSPVPRAEAASSSITQASGVSQGSYMDFLKTTDSSVPRSTASNGSSLGSFSDDIAKTGASTRSPSPPVIGPSQGSYLESIVGSSVSSTDSTSASGVSSGTYSDAIAKEPVTPTPKATPALEPTAARAPSPPISQGSYLDNIAKALASTTPAPETPASTSTAFHTSCLDTSSGPQTSNASTGSPQGASQGSYLDTIGKSQGQSSFDAPETSNISPPAQTEAFSAPAIEEKPAIPPMPEPKAASTPATVTTAVFQQGSYLDNTAKASAATSARVAGTSASQGSYLDPLAGPQATTTSEGAAKGASLSSDLDNVSKPQAPSSFGTPEVLKVTNDASTPVSTKPAVDVPATEPVDRVKGAYIDWCKKYGKDMDDSRYKIFSGHYLAMEEQWGGTATEMKLNQYADCTVEERVRLKELESRNVSTATSMLTAPETSNISPAPQTNASSASSATAIEKPVMPPVPEPQDASTSATPRPTVFQEGSYLDNIAKATAAASAPVAGASESRGSNLDELAGSQTLKTSMLTSPETSNMSPVPQTQPSSASSAPAIEEKPMPPPVPEPQDASTSAIPRPTSFQQGSSLDNIAKASAAASAPVAGASESQGSYLDELAGPQTPKTSMLTTPETSNITPAPQTQAPSDTETKDKSTRAESAAKTAEPSRGSFSDSLSKLVGEPVPAKQEPESEKSVKEEVDFARQADSIAAVIILFSRLIL